jgi:hypothetical protein
VTAPIYEWLKPQDFFPSLAPPLPDEPAVAPGRPRFVSGYGDGMAVYHHSEDHDPDGLDALYDTLIATVTGKDSTVNRLYDFAVAHHSMSLLFALLRRMTDEPVSAELHHRLFSLSWFLATKSADRGPVRLGIVLIGLFGPLTDEDEEMLRVLGRHDEFTLCVANTLLSAAPDPTAGLFRLAQQVWGWGRIHLVERLGASGDPSVLDWIVRSGYRNGISARYLTPVVALKCDLLTRLIGDECDADTMRAAADVLVSMLVEPSPRPFLRQYAEAARVTEAFLARLDTTSAGTRQTAAAVRAIHEFITARHEPWPAGWDDHTRQRVRAHCDRLLGPARRRT